MGNVNLEGQVKYWNETETYMPTPFPTSIHATYPADYFYVALYDATVLTNTHGADTTLWFNPAHPLASALDWQKVDQLVTEVWDPGTGTFIVNQDFMSYFKFTGTTLNPTHNYFVTVWDGSNLYQENTNLGTRTGLKYNPELGESYTWNNWGGVTALDALGIQKMSNGSTDMHSDPTPPWLWVGNQVEAGDLYYGYYSNSIANVNSVNNVSALDALTTQYRIAGLQPTFPNKTPNFRVAGRFVNMLPKQTWYTPFVKANAPIDVEFTKSAANYTYFTPAVNNYYMSNNFSTQPFLLAQSTSPTATCPTAGYINLYYEATGDVNANYVPPAPGFKAAPAMTLQYKDEMAVQKGQIIDIPVSVDRGANLGSLDLGMTFRNDLIKIMEVPGYEVVNISNEKGFVRLSWADLNGRSVNADEAIVTIKALVLADITPDTRLFELEAMTELGNVDAQKIENINLKTVTVSTKPAAASDLFVANYPNPFNSKTTISYNLPEAGNVTLVVYNKLGAEVRNVVAQYQTEGTHLIELNRADLAPGVYYYRLVLQGTKDTYTATRNMVITE